MSEKSNSENPKNNSNDSPTDQDKNSSSNKIDQSAKNDNEVNINIVENNNPTADNSSVENKEENSTNIIGDQNDFHNNQPNSFNNDIPSNYPELSNNNQLTINHSTNSIDQQSNNSSNSSNSDKAKQAKIYSTPKTTLTKAPTTQKYTFSYNYTNTAINGTNNPNNGESENTNQVDVEAKIDEFKRFFKPGEFNFLLLNSDNYEEVRQESGFYIYNRNITNLLLTVTNRQEPIRRTKSNPFTNASAIISIKYLSHIYKEIPASFNYEFFHKQLSCYLKNQSSSLAHLQGFNIIKKNDRFLPIALTERPANGPLSSLFSTVKFNQTKNLAESLIYRSDPLNIDDLTTITAEQKFVIIIGIIHGIAFIHKNKFIHSNLNPTTVYLNKKYLPIICDYIFIPPFKITTVKKDINSDDDDDDDDEDDEITFKYSIDPEEPIEFENEKYVAPEIKEGKEFSREVDIYSFGCLIEYILREGEEEEANTKTEGNKFGEKWNNLINNCKQEPEKRPTAIDILTELLKEENIKEYISEISPNSSAKEISEKTSLALTLIRNDVKNDLDSEVFEMKIFHLMIPNFNEIDENTKFVISVAEKGDIKSILKVADWFYTGKNNFYKDYEWSYECYKAAADKIYEIFHSLKASKNAEKKDLYPIIKVAEFNKNGIGTDIDLNMSHEYYEKALEIIKKGDPERSAIEKEKNDIYDEMCTLILTKVPKEKNIKRLFNGLNFEIKHNENGEYQTLQFDSPDNVKNAIRKIKSNNSKTKACKIEYKYTAYKTKKSHRYESLIRDLERINLDEFYPGKDNTEFEVLGSGSYANTYKVYKRGTEEVFAAKVFTDPITNNQVNSFKREIIMASKFDNHPSVVQYLGFNEYSLIEHYRGCKTTNIKPTILMKYVPCGHLEKAIRDKGNPLTDTNKLKIIIGIASGLSEFYDNGIIHRDLKPENILLNEKSEPVICDLGCSRQYSEKENYQFTRRVGTPIYMAPELYNIDFNPVYKCEVDSYSFGIILYQILTSTKCEDVYKVKYPYQLMKKKLENYVAPLPNDMNDIFKNLITSCWNMPIDERPKPPMIYEILKEAIFNNEKLLPNANLDEVKEYIKTLPNNKLEKVKRFIELLPASDIEKIQVSDLEDFKKSIVTLSNENENSKEFKEYVDALSNSDFEEIKKYIKTLTNNKL